MLNRRQFLHQAAGATVTLILTPLVSACGSSNTYGGGSSSTSNPTEPGCDGVQPESTVAESHTHTVCVPASDLSSPPSGGMTYTTSSSSSHTHKVTLSAAQLTAIHAGTSVTVNTSNEVDPLDGVTHMHAFTIAKATTAASQSPAPPGMGY